MLSQTLLGYSWIIIILKLGCIATAVASTLIALPRLRKSLDIAPLTFTDFLQPMDDRNEG